MKEIEERERVRRRRRRTIRGDENGDGNQRG